MKMRPHNAPAPDASTRPAPGSKPGKTQHIPSTRQPVLKENIEPNSLAHSGRKKKAPQSRKLVDYGLTRRQQSNKEVQQYEKQILLYLKSRQGGHSIQPNYLRSHHNISQNCRTSFLRHYFKLARKFHLRRTTLHLAVHYLDAYLSSHPELDKKEAIIAVQACMLIAMKYEQIYPPAMCQWTQPLPQILHTQSLILKSLDFNLSCHTLQHQLQYLFSIFQIPPRDQQMIRLLADVSLFDQGMHAQGVEELAWAMVGSIAGKGVEDRVEMSLKWMMERNEREVEWLHRYGGRKGK